MRPKRSQMALTASVNWSKLRLKPPLEIWQKRYIVINLVTQYLTFFAPKVELNLSVLWEDSSNSQCSEEDRSAAIARIDKMLLRLSRLDQADKKASQTHVTNSQAA